MQESFVYKMLYTNNIHFLFAGERGGTLVNKQQKF